MTGTDIKVNLASPVIITSVMFIATSIEIIEISDIPNAVLKASFADILFINIIVSKIIEVINPLIIAKIIINIVGQLMLNT